MYQKYLFLLNFQFGEVQVFKEHPNDCLNSSMSVVVYLLSSLLLLIWVISLPGSQFPRNHQLVFKGETERARIRMEEEVGENYEEVGEENP